LDSDALAREPTKGGTGEKDVIQSPKFGVRSSGTLDPSSVPLISPFSLILSASRIGRDARFVRAIPRGPGHCLVTGLVCAKQASGLLMKDDDE
jgi:hypothetical protein